MTVAESNGTRPATSRVADAALWIAAAAAWLLVLSFRPQPERFRPQPEGLRPQPEHAAIAGPARREAAAHGRFAATPSEIPARGWKDVLWRCYERLSEDRILAIAAGATFYGLLALFPAIAALVAIYGLVADPGTIAQHLDDMAGFVPAGALEVVHDQLARVSSQGNATLGLAFAFGLAVSLWSANAGIKALIDALNIAYAEREKRGIVRLNALSLVFTLAAILALIVALGAVVVLPLALQYLGLEHATAWIVTLAKWPLLFAGAALGIGALYRYGPSRNRAKWRWITWGSAFAALCWIAVSVLFSWYATNFGSYNKTYGSLGAVIGFMTWMWISTIVMLLGAELDAETEHQTSCDSTVGPPKPMGERGATMADTIGRARG